jgi:hypothetical protein
MSQAPKWFLPVVIVALLWNLMGCAAYLSDAMLSAADVCCATGMVDCGNSSRSLARRARLFGADFEEKLGRAAAVAVAAGGNCTRHLVFRAVTQIRSDQWRGLWPARPCADHRHRAGLAGRQGKGQRLAQLISRN